MPQPEEIYRTKPDGTLMHDGDCHWFSEKVCTCGLLHGLIVNYEKGIQLYPKLYEELGQQDWIMQKIQDLELVKKIPPPPSEEEVARRMKVIEDIFGPPVDKSELGKRTE